MPKHYAIDVNVIKGRAHFDNCKWAYVYFLNDAGQQISFTKQPNLQVTVVNNSTQPAVRLDRVKAGNLYTGAKIGFTQNQTIDVDWMVLE